MASQKTTTGYQDFAPANLISKETGTTVPTTGTAGYEKGALFIKTDASAGVSGVYRNIGTTTACVFVQQTTGVNASTGTVVALATGTTLTAADHFGKVITNTGASGAVTHTLPAASTVTGQSITFTVLAAQIVNISPAATDGVFLNGSGVDNKDLILAGTIGTTATITSNGDNYEVVFHTSAVTKEA